MLKLDRTAHRAGNIKDKIKESDFYKGMSLDQIAEIFTYLQSVAYNYPINQPPRMDKTVHYSR